MLTDDCYITHAICSACLSTTVITVIKWHTALWEMMPWNLVLCEVHVLHQPYLKIKVLACGTCVEVLIKKVHVTGVLICRTCD